MQLQTIDEKKIIEDSKKDPQCFEALYNKYYEIILKFVFKRVESLDDCREVTAIVFTKALANIGKYTHKGFPFSSWLYRIAINEIAQFYRNQSKHRIISLNEKGLNNIVDEAGKETELITVLKTALMYLPKNDLLLIELRYFEEKSFSEIGDILEITENNAKVKTYRAIDKLKKIYSKIS
ncbi:MAG: sigma-70 family RNA polymerase sigma factor [Bacteroidia bacterium]|nr:sigma-70 family RNA polymerase sigma factor [Bacteroidia bacterium]